MFNGPVWTPTNREMLSHMINVDRMTFTQAALAINEKLGTSFTRESIAGAVKRWGLRKCIAEPRHRPSGLRLNARANNGPQFVTPPQTKAVKQVHPDGILNKKFTSLRSGQCKFETSGFWVKSTDYRFCGLPTPGGHIQYCDHHMQIAYRPK
jgi:hypothetical protein